MKKQALLINTGLLAVGLMAGASFAQAQAAGTLDTTFGTGGTVSTNVSNPELFPLGGFEQANGDIVVIGTFDQGTTLAAEIGLARYTPAGKLDTTFGTKGITITEINGFESSPVGFAVEPNGDILVASTATVDLSGGEFTLLRYTANGKLDTTFGAGGIVVSDFPGDDDASVLLLQPNGQILVGGFHNASSNKGAGAATLLVRYNSNGTLDTTFGAEGMDAVQIPGLAAPEALALLTNGNYLALGSGAIVEFSSTGALLSTATPGTLAATSVPVSSCCSPAVFQPNGDFLVAQIFGTTRLHSDVQLQQFSPTGAQVTSFITTPVLIGPGEDEPQEVVLQPNGQILVAGLTNGHQTPIEGGLARLNANGALDTTFGAKGVISPATPLAAVLVQTDGKIVTIGSSGENLVLSRYFGN